MQIYNKEAVYDEQLAPLLNKVISICKEHGIQMLASFALMDEDPNYDNEPMLCTSYTPGDTWNAPEIQEARAVVMGHKKTVQPVVYDLLQVIAKKP